MRRVRFAPSPTGFLHIGGARTCLFNWLYARKHRGKFLLRIEDTDSERSKKEYLEEILESINWLGLDWDEIFYQSQRFTLYQKFAKKLIDKGKAYKKEGAIYFKYEFQQIEVEDLIRGKIVFKELPKEEEVIIKSDNTPTYNFSCVIDDALLGITHVIRGEDHISNTPKQILMYKALGFKIPEFAHLPLILSPQGGRLSKRLGATSIREYRKMGYLSPALVNYLLLLGWSPGGNREIISLKEAKEVFDIKDVNKTSAIFSWDKLNWLNSHYIKNTPSKSLLNDVLPLLKERGLLKETTKKDYIIKVIELFQTRMQTLQDLAEWGYFCFGGDFSYSDETKEILSRPLKKEIRTLKENLERLETFSKEKIEETLRSTARDLGLKARDLVHPARVALTGRKIGPGLFETMEVLGKEKVIQRLEKLIAYWDSYDV